MSENEIRLSEFLRKHFAEENQPGEEAVDAAIRLLSKVKNIPPEATARKIVFAVSVRYEDGLGAHILNLPEIQSLSPDEANKLAYKQAEAKIGKNKTIEVRVKPLGLAKA